MSSVHAGRLERPRGTLVDAVRVALDHRRRRRAADDWIRAGRETRSDRYGWRIAQLTAPRERRLLARFVRALIEDLQPALAFSAAPVNRVALRPNAPLLDRLAARLEAFDRPVSAAGVLATRDLLTQPRSPFYAPLGGDATAAVERSLLRVLDALEVH